MACSLTLPSGKTIPFVSDRTYEKTMREEIEPALAALRQEIQVPVRGGTLHAENYVLPDSKRAILVLHGYTESAEKLREMTWYFLQAGFSVFSYDHRGHAHSLRQLSDATVAHVDHFDDYVDDLETFVHTCVTPGMGNAPLSLYAHSMGGAVGAHFLLRHPQLLHKAVLSSPMIAPSSGAIPLWVGHAMTKTMVMLGQGKKRAFIGGPYDPDKETFEASCTTSPARFAYYTDKRKATPCLQVCAPSYQWVLEAIVQTKSLMRKPACQAVRTPVLLCQAKLDDVVRLPEQNQFIQLLPHGELVCFDKAKHEIFNSPDEVMKPYVQKVLTFLLSE